MRDTFMWAAFATAGALLAFALAFLTPAGAFAQDRYDVAIIMFVQADGSNCYSLTIRAEVAKTVILLVQGRDT